MSELRLKRPNMDNKWEHVNKILSRAGPLAADGFEENMEAARDFAMNHAKVLVVGAGGLGCELLKDLALVGIKNIHVIDMDIIDLSNLNRQFLFREKDIGEPKAKVAAAFINSRVKGANVIPHYGRIEDKDNAFYRQFSVVVLGLDSIVARRWINSTLISLLKYDAAGTLDPSSIIPLVDGGTEGFHGNDRVVYPGMTACLECMLSLYPPQVNFPMCTLANTPRRPEHCIEYAKLVFWPKEREGEVLDGDNPEHITWLYERSLERAQEYGIEGVTYRLTQGVTKRIIPNVASTSAVIAATSANEVLKILTSCAAPVNNNMLFNDVEGVYMYAYEYARDPACLVCSNIPLHVSAEPTMSLEDFIETLKENAMLQFKAPSVTATIAQKNKSLYMQRPPFLEKATRANLTRTLEDLGLSDQHKLTVTDPTQAASVTLILNLKG